MVIRSNRTSRLKTPESRIYRKVDVRFGGGPTEKGCHEQHLAGGLPSGAFLYMSAGGNPHHMERGKSAMVNALAGLAIVLTARVIAGMIKSAIGGQ